MLQRLRRAWGEGAGWLGGGMEWKEEEELEVEGREKEGREAAPDA